MFARRFSIQRIDVNGIRHPCPIGWIDNFAMRDGVLEAGARVPLDRLQAAMEDWFRRKSYLKPGERLEVAEIVGASHRG
jgi:hypothetical protein